MSTVVIILLIALGAFVAVGSAFALAAFGRYCDQVAKLQGRVEERHNHVGSDENVKNAFERELYWNLMLGRHRLPGDLPVNQLGDRLAIGFRVLLIASMGLIVCVAVMFG